MSQDNIISLVHDRNKWNNKKNWTKVRYYFAFFLETQTNQNNEVDWRLKFEYT